VYGKKYSDTYFSFLLGRIPKHDYWQNALDDYTYQAICDVCDIENILLPQLFGEIR
jgi:hypothetical protein